MTAAIWIALLGGTITVFVHFHKEYQERKRVKIAVFAELHRLMVVLERHRIWWQSCVESGDTDFPLIPFLTPVYDAHQAHLGHLDIDVIAKVVRFYGFLKFINSMQLARQHYAGARAEVFDRQYLETLMRVIRDHVGVFDTVFVRYRLAD